MKNIFFLFFSFLLKFLPLNASTPFPQSLLIMAMDTEFYPILFLLDSDRIILTKGGPYLLKEGLDGTLSFGQPPSILSADDFIATPFCYTFLQYENATSGDVEYVFPYLSSKIVTLTKKANGALDYSTAFSFTVMDNSRINAEKFNDTTMIRSYLNGRYFVICELNSKSGSFLEGNSKMLDVNVSENAIFTCRAVTSQKMILCLIQSDNDILYFILDPDALEFGDETNVLASFTFDAQDQDNYINAIDFITINANNFYGVIHATPANIFYLFNGTISDDLVTVSLDAKRRTNIPTTNTQNMFLFSIFEKYIMVSGFDGARTHCGMFDTNLEQLTIDGSDICGYKDAKMTILDDGKLHFISIQNGNTLYYIEQELVVGTTLSDTFYGERLININEMVTPQLKYVNEGNKIKIVSMPSSEYESIKVVDRVNNESDLEYQTITAFDYYIKYIPHTKGQVSIKLQIYLKLSDDYFLPIPLAELNFVLECHPLCQTCSVSGSDSDNKCDTCPDGYTLVGSNCVSQTSPPEGYYYDSDAGEYKQCLTDCKKCSNGDVCEECSTGYELLSEFTKESSDNNKCVEECDLTSHRWYINTSNGQFKCIEDSVGCPSDYSQYIEDAKRCIKDGTDNNTGSVSTEEIPYSVTENLIGKYLDKNIVAYYKEKYQRNLQYMTVSIYSIKDSVNSNFPFDNITIINFAEILNEDEEYIVAQVDTPNKTFFDVYSLDGKIIEIDMTRRVSVERQIKDIELSNTIKENNISLNKEDAMYNDYCVNYSIAKNGSKVDVAIKDRREFLQTAHTTLCGNGCEIISLDETNKTNCQCNLTIYHGNILLGDTTEGLIFDNTIAKSNFKLLKCIDIAFKPKIVKTNIGFYIQFAFLVIQVAIIICHVVLTHKKNITPNNSDMQSVPNTSTSNRTDLKMDQKSALNLNHRGSDNRLQIFKQNTRNTIDVNQVNTNTKSVLTTTSSTVAKEESLSLCEVFIDKVKKTHPIYYCIIHPVTYNRYPLLSRLFLLLSYEMMFNSLFYSDKYISHTFREKCSFPYEIEIIIAASISSIVVNILLKVVIHHGNCIAYYIVVIIISFFAVYCNMVFCAVYQYNDTHLIYGVLFSIVITFGIFPLLVSIICLGLYYISCMKKGELMICKYY